MISVKIHEVEVVNTTKEYLYLRVDRRTIRLAWSDCSPSLAAATPEQREFIEVSPSGYGLHWPLLDEDLAVGPLLLLGVGVDAS